MPNPITWRNVFSEPAHVTGLLQNASQSANAAFNSFNRVVAREQDAQRQQYEAQVNLAATAARDILDSYRTADELSAAQAAGEVDTRLSELGPYLNRDEFRGAAENRIGELRARELAEYQRLDEEARRTNRDFLSNAYQQVLTKPDSLVSAMENLDNAPAPLTNRVEALQSLMSAASTGQEREDFMRRRRQDLAIENAYRAVDDAAAAFLNTAHDNAEALLRAGVDSGIPLTDNGTLDYRRATPTQLAQFDKTLKDQELLTKGQSATQYINQVVREMSSNRDLPPQEARALRADLETQLLIQTELTIPDQLELQEIENRYKQTYSINTNPFYGERKDVAEEALEVLSSFPEFTETFSESRRSRLVKNVASALSGNLKIGGNEVRVTPAVMKLVLQSQDWSLWNTDSKDIDTNLSDIAEKLDLASQYKQYNEYQSAIGQERSRFLRERGVKPAYDTMAREAATAINEAAKESRRREMEARRRQAQQERAQRRREEADRKNPRRPVVEESEPVRFTNQLDSARIDALDGPRGRDISSVLANAMQNMYADNQRGAESNAMLELSQDLSRALRQSW